MNAAEEAEIKKEFQLERIIFFSDAVFAIIITIMVLDVKLPELAGKVNEAVTKNAFVRIFPKLAAYTVSFFVIGSFWMRHLKVFNFLKDYDKPLIIFNLVFLFSVSLFPFALSFGLGDQQIMQYFWGYYTYTCITSFTFFTQTLLIGYVVKKSDKLCVKNANIDFEFKWKTRRLSLFTVPAFVIFFYVVIQYHLDLRLLIIPGVIGSLIIKRQNNKYYPETSRLKKIYQWIFKSPKKIKHPVKQVEE